MSLGNSDSLRRRRALPPRSLSARSSETNNDSAEEPQLREGRLAGMSPPVGDEHDQAVLTGPIME